MNKEKLLKEEVLSLSNLYKRLESIKAKRIVMRLRDLATSRSVYPEEVDLVLIEIDQLTKALGDAKKRMTALQEAIKDRCDREDYEK